MINGESSSNVQALCMEVVSTVADAEDVDPCDLPQPLADAINPDALNALFRNRPDADGKVRFQYCGHKVVVKSDGNVDVQSTDSS